MSTPDYSAKVEALENALASGELTVESDGDRVTYRSVADLTSALEYFRSKQAQADTPASSQSTFGFSAASFCRD